jgi:putative ATP-dependent endonuclease of OLD family
VEPLLPDQEQAEELISEIIEEELPRAKLPLLFLHSLEIVNFRSMEKAAFKFQPGLNVIIGANNAAKTAVIDALRIILNLGTFEKKEDFIRLKSTDVYLEKGVTSTRRTISFKATFYGKKDSDLPAQFYDMLSVGEEVEVGEDKESYVVLNLLYSVDFEFNKSTGRYAVTASELKGGKDNTNPVAYETLDYMRSVYLAPLRDLLNDRTRVGAEIERLILSHTSKGEEDNRKKIPQALKEQALQLIEAVTRNKHEAAASKNLAEYAKPYRIKDDSISFIPSGISDELFSTLLPVFSDSLHGLDKLPLDSNGLGINQLIYASIVLSRRGATEVDGHVRKFFLIEEPEAHLHPQLQDSFFHALNGISDHQIFVTSHSPTITAKTDIEKIIVMRRNKANTHAAPLHLVEVFKDREDDKRYLHKFLDITRSQLLFAKGAIFVEGVTEAMLLQEFSEAIDSSLRDNAIELVVVDSNQGFEHFRPLFDNGDEAYSRAVFITDGDEDPATVHTDEELKAGYDAEFDQELIITDNTAIATGYGTFEFCLLRASVISPANADMQEMLKTALTRASSLTDVAKSNFVQDFLDFEQPSLSYQKMKEGKKGVYITDETLWHGTWRTNAYFKNAKSDFAFYLNEELCKLSAENLRQHLTLPRYIEQAIRFVVDDPATPDEEEVLDDGSNG